MLSEAGVRAFKKDAVPEKIQALLPSSPNILELVSRQNWQAQRLSAQAVEMEARGPRAVLRVDREGRCDAQGHRGRHRRCPDGDGTAGP